MGKGLQVTESRAVFLELGVVGPSSHEGGQGRQGSMTGWAGSAWNYSARTPSQGNRGPVAQCPVQGAGRLPAPTLRPVGSPCSRLLGTSQSSFIGIPVESCLRPVRPPAVPTGRGLPDSDKVLTAAGPARAPWPPPRTARSPQDPVSGHPLPALGGQ